MEICDSLTRLCLEGFLLNILKGWWGGSPRRPLGLGSPGSETKAELRKQGSENKALKTKLSKQSSAKKAQQTKLSEHISVNKAQ